MRNPRTTARAELLRRRKVAVGARIAGCAAASIVAIACVAGCGGGEAGKAQATVTVTAPNQGAGQSAGAAKPAPSAAAPSTSSGPGSSATGSPAPSTAKAATGTIASADAICARRNGELAAISGSAADAGATGSVESRRVAIERRALDELAKLKPPAGVVLGYQRVLVYSQAMLERAQALSRSASATDAKGTPLAKAAIKGQLRLLIAAVRTGLKDCYPVD
jgi:hypothetical protein